MEKKRHLHIMFETAGPHIPHPRMTGGVFTCGLQAREKAINIASKTPVPKSLSQQNEKEK